jgi:hydroxyacylglutathione hydrolase
MPLDLVLVPCSADNYAVLLHDAESGATAVVDTPDPAPIAAELDRRGWRLSHILITHHHGDHTAGNMALKERFGATVVGPEAEAATIPGLDIPVREGSALDFAGREVRVIETPGHTRGHVTFYLPEEGVAFAGDTLFTLGCGRLLEDTPEAMWRSLGKLAALPGETLVYSGHEYTQSNARFALTIEPDNAALRARAQSIDAARARGEPTVPTTIALELSTNPFLRAGEPWVKAAIGLPESASDVESFAEIRRRKDGFR